MIATRIKRGRPKKSDQTPKENLGAPATNHSESIAFVNKRFIDKDGFVCTVTYGGCKAKPIEIRAK
jgi:hypothetical protein